MDLSHYAGNGECSCPDFTLGLAKLIQSGNTAGFETRCKHIKDSLCAVAGMLVDFQMERDAEALGVKKETAGRADWPLKPGWNT